MTPSSLEQILVLVVDDEASARQRLTDLLRKDSQVGNILEAENGIVAVDLIRSKRPDLVLLDVFVTAYDQHAIRAFEANALDYLLKPFSDERYESAMARVKARLDEWSLREFGQHILDMVARAPAREGWLDRFVVKSGGTTSFVRAADIDWIEAAGMYVNLHVAGNDLLYRATLHELAKKLDPRRFVRVHRSAIVNIESVLRLEPISHGEFEVILKHGSRSRISRTYRPQLEKRLGQPL